VVPALWQVDQKKRTTKESSAMKNLYRLWVLPQSNGALVFDRAGGGKSLEAKKGNDVVLDTIAIQVLGEKGEG